MKLRGQRGILVELIGAPAGVLRPSMGTEGDTYNTICIMDMQNSNWLEKQQEFLYFLIARRGCIHGTDRV